MSYELHFRIRLFDSFNVSKSLINWDCNFTLCNNFASCKCLSFKPMKIRYFLKKDGDEVIISEGSHHYR